MGNNIILPQVRQYVQSMGGKIIGSCGPAVLVRTTEPDWQRYYLFWAAACAETGWRRVYLQYDLQNSTKFARRYEQNPAEADALILQECEKWKYVGGEHPAQFRNQKGVRIEQMPVGCETFPPAPGETVKECRLRAVEIQPHWIGEILRTYPLEQPAVLAFGRYFALVRRVKPKSVRYLLVGPHSTQSASMMDCYPCWTSPVPEETGREAERNPAVLASLFGRFRAE